MLDTFKGQQLLNFSFSYYFQLSKSLVIDSYTDYVNNWKKAREKLKSAEQSKPAFSRFLEVRRKINLNSTHYSYIIISRSVHVRIEFS